MVCTSNEPAWVDYVNESQWGDCNHELSKEDKGGQPFHTSVRQIDWAGITERQRAKGRKGDVMMEERGNGMEEEHVNSAHSGLIRGMRDERGSRSSRRLSVRVRYNVTAEQGYKARDEFTNASPKDERRVRDERVGLNGCVPAQEVMDPRFFIAVVS